MFEIRFAGEDTIQLIGRFDGSQATSAEEFLDRVASSATVDFEQLDYISSAGLGILFATQKRLKESGEALTLKNLNPHIREVFALGGFDTIFEIE
jgi:anti-sigma B factor antagonist